MNGLLRFGVVILGLCLLYVLPLEVGPRTGLSWMVRSAVAVAMVVWAFGGVKHLRVWGTTQEQGTTLAVFRVLIGACLVWTVFTVVQADLVGVIWVTEDEGGYRELNSSFWLVRLLGGATAQNMMRLAWVSMASGMCLIVGLGGRAMAFVALQSFMSISDINAHAGGSYDELLSNALWILVLAPSTETLSVDCKVQSGQWTSHRLVYAWPRYLVMFQIVLVYWTTGVQKVSAYWVPGGEFSALYYILQQPSWHRFEMSWLAWIFPVTQMGTAISWFWEVLSPIWLLAMWYRYTADRSGWMRQWFNRLDVRLWYAAVGIFFHVIIFGLMDVGPFSPISVAFYIAFWHPQELRQCMHRMRRVFATKIILRKEASPVTLE